MALPRDFYAESETVLAAARRAVNESRMRVAGSRALIDTIAQRLERSGLSSELTPEIEIQTLERLHGMTVRFLHTHSVAALLEDALDALMRVTAAPLGNVQLLNRATGMLNIAVQEG